MAWAVFLQPIDDNTTPRNIELVGEVIEVDELLEEGGPSKSACDGLTSVTPPRYADDGMQLLYFESEEVAREISAMLRDDFIENVNSGDLKPRDIPAWSTNPTNTSFIRSARTVALLPKVREAFPTDRVSDSQLISASEKFLQENGRVATSSELTSWIEANRDWETL